VKGRLTTPQLGIDELREAIAETTGRKYRVKVLPSRSGASGDISGPAASFFPPCWSPAMK